MQRKRVTQRDVADAAGVSRPTVSLSLRHHPSIPEPTRQRILALAEKMGYVPDPVLSVLAGYRWPASKPRRSMASIALVELRRPDEPEQTAHRAAVRRGVVASGQAAGFSVSTFNLHEYGGNLSRLLRVLRHRGITGIILLPTSPVALDPKARWHDFSVVTAASSMLTPRFHQVMPNQLHKMSILLQKLQELGQPRIGAIYSERYDECTAHAYSMALGWFGHGNRILILPATMSDGEMDRHIAEWLRTHDVEIVLAEDPDGIGRLPEVKVVCRSRPNMQIVALGSYVERYIEQFPDLIGQTAVRILSGMMYNNETGIPEHPQITTINGVVRENSVPSLAR